MSVLCVCVCVCVRVCVCTSDINLLSLPGQLYDAGDTDSDPGDKAKLLQEVTATDVKVVKREDIFPIHLKTPVHLKAGHRYVLAVKGSGRKETPSGKGGQAKVTGVT